jgi:pseudaminic acid synthase
MIEICGRMVGLGAPPFIVAEMSGNHNQSLDRALAIVEAAAAAGAHAMKLQTYTADTMTINLREGEFYIGDSNSLWAGNSLYELYQQAHTPWEWHEPIFQRSRELGMIPFSTPFDETAVDFLETLDVGVYKIASFENTDLPLIRKVAATGKPMIISTGMASVAELDETVRAARKAGCQDLVLLKCTSNYPSTPENSNVRTIPHLRELFRCEVGLSDHTMGCGAALAAVALGASVIEKHFTLARSDGGVDAAFSLEPAEFKLLTTETERAWQSLGKVQYGEIETEKKSLVYRRSLYVVANIAVGEVFNADNVKAIRPGLGLAPKWIDRLIGVKSPVAIKRGTPLSLELLGISNASK